MTGFLILTFLIVGTPGPATISAAGVAKGFGFWAGMRYQLGLLTGGSITHFILWAAISGGLYTSLNLFAPQLLGTAQLLLGLVATGLLLWIAWKIGTASGELRIEAADQAPGFWQGVMLNLVNPKIYFGMFPLYYNPELGLGWSSQPLEFAFKFVAILVLAFVGHTLWVWFGSSVGDIRMSARNTRIMNACFGLALVAITLWALWLLIKDNV